MPAHSLTGVMMMRDVLRKIPGSATWWQTYTDDPSAVSAQYQIQVSGVIYDTDGTETTYQLTSTAPQTLRLLMDRWGSYSVVIDSHFDTSPDDAAAAASFAAWHARNSTNLSRIITAYLSKYNPLHNYDGVEVETDDIDPLAPITHTKTISGKIETATDIGTTTESGGKNGSVVGDATTTTYSTTYDDTTTPKMDGQAVSAPMLATGKTTGTAAGNYVNYNQYVETITDTGDRIITRKRGGNLGVTMSQQMVDAELRLRRHDILYDYLAMYVADCMILDTGDDAL